jgi:hypothetical protein
VSGNNIYECTGVGIGMNINPVHDPDALDFVAVTGNTILNTSGACTVGIFLSGVTANAEHCIIGTNTIKGAILPIGLGTLGVKVRVEGNNLSVAGLSGSYAISGTCDDSAICGNNIEVTTGPTNLTAAINIAGARNTLNDNTLIGGSKCSYGINAASGSPAATYLDCSRNRITGMVSGPINDVANEATNWFAGNHSDQAFTFGANSKHEGNWQDGTTTVYPFKMPVSMDSLQITDGITAPSTVSGKAVIYVDTADGDLKIKFGDGTVKTIVVDT